VVITINMTNMLRITLLSLLLGALALIAGITLFFSPPGTSGSQIPAITLTSANANVVLGTGEHVNGELRLLLNEAGQGAVNLAGNRIDARNYPFLHLEVEASSKITLAAFSWFSQQDVARHSYIPHSRSWSWLWLATNEIKDWKGYIGDIGLVFFGQAGEIVRIREFGIYPASRARQLKAILSDLTGYVPWNRAAMNSYTGVTPVSSFYPSALTVALLALSLFAYGVILLVLRARVTFSWHVVALIFLACWISLDLLWQNRLLHQVADTYHTFSGKSVEEKLAVGPDAKLYDFIKQVIPLAQPRDARVFVSSSDTYLGQRGAYYMYPLNVYWPGPSGEFPSDYLLHGGDLIVLINPTPMRFNEATNMLATSSGTTLGAELLFSNAIGKVVRLK